LDFSVTLEAKPLGDRPNNVGIDILLYDNETWNTPVLAAGFGELLLGAESLLGGLYRSKRSTLRWTMIASYSPS